MIAADPHQGGATWAVLQYVLGFQRLGYDVVFIEPVSEPALRPKNCDFSASANARYFREVMAEFGLKDNAALLLSGARRTVGIPYDELCKIARRADLLINISGMLMDEDIIGPIPRRVYLDLDPAFIQLWHSACHVDMRFTGHTHFVTIGLALGAATCPVPTCGLRWITTPQPVVLAEWPRSNTITQYALTTVGNWRGYGSIEFQGQYYGQKAHSLRSFFSLPNLTEEKFALALSIHPEEKADVTALAENRWQILDPASVAGTPASYRGFIQGSKAEFGIAKSGYVVSRCGWFSDRSVCYLASGRPVIAQETGFSDYFPTGEGLFSFVGSDDVLAGIDAINRDYATHSRAARALAETLFDSDKVLNHLLEQIDAAS